MIVVRVKSPAEAGLSIRLLPGLTAVPVVHSAYWLRGFVLPVFWQLFERHWLERGTLRSVLCAVLAPDANWA